MFGLCAALTIQIITGFAGFALQSTAFLTPLDMKWPGILDASVRGASVVELQNGLRILRAYGTLPHPNILGGFVLICLLGPISFFLDNRKSNYTALLLVVWGIILLGLTFSRSAWLGLIAFILLLLLKFRHLDHKRVALFAAISALTIALVLFPLRDLVSTRIGKASVSTEKLSVFGRSWLTEQAVNSIRTHPLMGIGSGSFIIDLSENAVEGAVIEPVHNIPLLVGAELGIVSLILLAGLILVISLQVAKARSPRAILASGTLAGLGMIGLFDHYLWSLAPGRLMLGLALGLWAGQVYRDGA
jgi:O-antigen ligase